MIFVMILNAMLLLLLSGCTRKDLTIDADKDILPRRINIPKMKKRLPQIVSYPKQWRKRINVNVGSSMPIKEFLRDTAIECGVSLNLDQVPEFSGISYTARNTEFLAMLKNICRLAGWRIRIMNSGDIAVMKDSHYIHTHEVAFICNFTKMRTSTNLKNFAKDEKSHMGDLSSESQLNLWEDLEKNLKFLLKEKDSGYSINKQGGLVIVNALQAEHQIVARYIKKLKERIDAQAMVEMRIMSVVLNKGFKNGIEWDYIPTLRAATDNSNNKIKILESITSGINMIKHFGDMKTLSNPSTMILNNHPAIFRMTSNKVYFRVKAYQQEEIEKPGKEKGIRNIIPRQPMVDTEPQVIPVGIQMYLQPSISFANSAVSLHVKAIISSADDSKAALDPAVSIMKGNVQSRFPVVEESSIDTCINLEDGEVVMIGGLMSSKELPTRLGFRDSKFIANSKCSNNEELVIILKVNIVYPPENTRKDLQSWEIDDLM